MIQAPEFGPFEFCVWRQLCPFPEVHSWPTAPLPAPRWPQFRYLAEASKGNYALFHGPRPEFSPFEVCVWRQLFPVPEVHCWPPAPPPAPRWPRFGYLAEDDYAQSSLGPLCQRDTLVMWPQFGYLAETQGP